VKRNKHSLSHYKLLTGNMGYLYPIACFEALPGDSIQQATSLLLRVSPLVAPVMHPVSVRVHHWFVPYRLIWSGWEDFITGGSDGEGAGTSWPYITTPGSPGVVEGSLHDYLGVPPGLISTQISALPFRAYSKIFNENYRDEDLVTARTISTASGADSTSTLTLANIAWEKDPYTTSRPWPQKGPEVTLPLGTTAPVDRVSNAPSWDVYVENTDGLNGASSITSSGAGELLNGIATGLSLDPKGGLIADLAGATAVDVNSVREAFALQRYQEARARYGSRYTEYLRYLGVRSSDSRLARPEYLGGGKQTISFSEVLQTAMTEGDADDYGVGVMRGHGISAMRSRRYRRFFEEHGLVLSLLSVRPRTMYAEGLDRMWTRTTKEDYFQKELEAIGQQEVLNREVYAMDSGPTDVFGYQDRYHEYRRLPSKIAGEFRTTLDYWHMARLFGADVTLNSTFVSCNPTDRIYQVATNDVLWIMASHSIQARRMVNKNAFSRIF